MLCFLLFGASGRQIGGFGGSLTAMVLRIGKKMKADRLFLEKGCPHCSVIRATLDMESAVRDDFRGSEGQAFLVFTSLSNDASIELLDKFGLAGKTMPVLVKHNGDIIDNPDIIATYLKQNRMAVK